MAWDQEQRNNAAIIAAVGRQLGASDRDIQIAIAAAIVESDLRNINYGDRDSIGLFQQRNAWGSRSARLDPAEAAKMFFTGGAGGQRGLLDFGNRDNMGFGEAAQAVQVSAFPGRYAEHQSEAQQLYGSIDSSKSTGTLGSIPGLSDLLASAGDQPAMPSSVTEVNGIGEITADEAGIGAAKFDQQGSGSPVDALSFGMQPLEDPMAKLHLPTLDSYGINFDPSGAGNGWRAAVVAAARKMLGTPYVWGGTSHTGVDCSGLVSLIYNNHGFELPRLSADQARSGQRIALDHLKPGDLVGWDNSSRNVGADHIAIYIGNGMIIEAPRPGGVVQISHIYDTGDAWGVRLHR